MESKLNLLDLPLIAHHKILVLLGYQEIFTNVARVCLKLNKFIASSPSLLFNCLMTLLGDSSIAHKLLDSAPKEQVLQILKCFACNSKRIELPYFGFKTDGGCYNNDPYYFMQNIFQENYGGFMSAYASQPIKECHVEGALAFDYYRSKNADAEALSKNGFSQEFVKPFSDYVIQKQFPDVRSVLEQKALSSDDKNIELSYLPLHDCSSVITSVLFKRPHNFTCLTKTIMLFCSDSKIEYDHPVVRCFSGASTTEDIIKLLSTPSYLSSSLKIAATNIPQLKLTSTPSANIAKEIERLKDSVEIVYFKNTNNNNEKLADAQPILWIRIKAGLYNVNINLLRDNYFSARYVLGKFMDRDVTSFEPEQNRNYDLKSISLNGILLPYSQRIANFSNYMGARSFSESVDGSEEEEDYGYDHSDDSNYEENDEIFE